MRARSLVVTMLLAGSCVVAGCGGDNLSLCDGCRTPTPTPTPVSTVATLTPTPATSGGRTATPGEMTPTPGLTLNPNGT